MRLGLTYQLIRFILDLVLVRTSSEAQLRAEVLALRHQLRVLERKVGKPIWQPGDRLVLAGLSRLLSKAGWASLCRGRRRCCAGIASWFAASGRPSAIALRANARAATRSGGR